LKGKVEMHFGGADASPANVYIVARLGQQSDGDGFQLSDSDNVDSIFVVPLDVKRMRGRNEMFANQ
jgi:hypothetical protein